MILEDTKHGPGGFGGFPESARSVGQLECHYYWRIVNGLLVVGREFRGPGGAERRLARKLPPAGGLSGKNSIDQESPGWPRFGFRERARNASAARRRYRTFRQELMLLLRTCRRDMDGQSGACDCGKLIRRGDSDTESRERSSCTELQTQSEGEGGR